MLAQAVAPTIDKNTPFYFGEEMPDGRLTAEYSNETIRLRDAIAESKRKGRPLTQAEMNKYISK